MEASNFGATSWPPRRARMIPMFFPGLGKFTNAKKKPVEKQHMVVRQVLTHSCWFKMVYAGHVLV